MVPYGFEVILCHGQLLMVIAKAVVAVAVVAGAFVAIAGTMVAVACPAAVSSDRAGRPDAGPVTEIVPCAIPATDVAPATVVAVST